MTMRLNERGQIGIPKPIRDSDHLCAGDAFNLVRLTPGHYLLSKHQEPAGHFTVAAGADGLPVIRVASGVITSEQVKYLESQTQSVHS
jgi:bifunctional DNA-binding transcriptional regulator/antitoxin component of YhaV-PrlF toxin-antitoxin module